MNNQFKLPNFYGFFTLDVFARVVFDLSSPETIEAPDLSPGIFTSRKVNIQQQLLAIMTDAVNHSEIDWIIRRMVNVQYMRYIALIRASKA